MKHRLLLIFLLCLHFQSFAQSDGELTEAQRELIRQRVVQKVDEFVDALGNMVDSSLTHEVRVDNQQNLLNLFMAKGEPYDLYDFSLQDNVHSTGVKIQTSSTSRKTITPQRVKDYVRKLYNPRTRKNMMGYSKIKISKAAAVRVDNLVREGDRWVCVAYFFQDFFGYRENGTIRYSDRTGKRIKCYITPIKIPGGDTVYDPKLGDIEVVSTERI